MMDIKQAMKRVFRPTRDKGHAQIVPREEEVYEGVPMNSGRLYEAPQTLRRLVLIARALFERLPLRKGLKYSRGSGVDFSAVA